MNVADASGKHPPHPGMVWITGGTFRMGSDKHYPEEAPVHRVATVDGFWMDPTPAQRHDSAILVAEQEEPGIAARIRPLIILSGMALMTRLPGHNGVWPGNGPHHQAI